MGKTDNFSAICGGVVKESEFFKEPYGHMMAMIMPDEHYEAYEKLYAEGKKEEAEKLFEKYAWSAI